jgi:hypothetical protein
MNNITIVIWIQIMTAVMSLTVRVCLMSYSWTAFHFMSTSYISKSEGFCRYCPPIQRASTSDTWQFWHLPRGRPSPPPTPPLTPPQNLTCQQVRKCHYNVRLSDSTISANKNLTCQQVCFLALFILFLFLPTISRTKGNKLTQNLKCQQIGKRQYR